MNQNQRNSAIIFRKNRTLRERRFYLICCVIKRLQNLGYMLSNPPFGVEWKKVQTHIKKEHETKGFGGRFGAGLPRISDGSFLFLQHMISKRVKQA